MMTVQGWWFGPSDDKLLHDDGRLAEVGVTHRVTGELVPCRNALHMTERVINALPNAGGLILWRVEGGDEIIHCEDGIVACRSRKYLARANATETVIVWARRVASDVMHLWEAPEIVRRFLDTGQEPRAAAYAAYAASAAIYMEYAAHAAAYAAARAAYAAESAAVVAYATNATSAARATHAAYAAKHAVADAAAYDKYTAWLEEACNVLLEGGSGCD